MHLPHSTEGARKDKRGRVSRQSHLDLACGSPNTCYTRSLTWFWAFDEIHVCKSGCGVRGTGRVLTSEWSAPFLP
jgi:hypothetical protein